MRIRTLLATGLLVLATAACGGHGDEPAASASPTLDREAQAVKYSQCMRENGVPSFPDPVDGRIQLNARKGSDLDPESDGFKRAEQACKQYEPDGAGRQGPGNQQQALKWVQCMRQNGVPGMPDPQPDGRMLITGDNGVDPESQTFKDAQQKCRDVAPGGMGR